MLRFAVWNSHQVHEFCHRASLRIESLPTCDDIKATCDDIKATCDESLALHAQSLMKKAALNVEPSKTEHVELRSSASECDSTITGYFHQTETRCATRLTGIACRVHQGVLATVSEIKYIFFTAWTSLVTYMVTN